MNSVLAEDNKENTVNNLKILKIYSRNFKGFCKRFPTLDVETIKLLF